MKKRLLLIFCCIHAIILNAQFTHKIGDGFNASNLPYNNRFDYNWCSVIYPQNKINISGDITKISYWLYSYEPSSDNAQFQEVYMAHTSDIEFSDAGYPDTASMTLVYSGLIQFRDHNFGLAEIVLTTPFAYNNEENLLVHIENHDGSKSPNANYYLINNSSTTTVFPCKYNNQDGTFPETAGTRTHESPNIYLTFDSGLDAGISAVNGSNNFLLPGLHDVQVSLRNYMGDIITEVDIDWEINGLPQSTVHWTGSVNPGQQTEAVTLATDYNFNPDTFEIKAWTSAPNMGVDELNTNDTLTQIICVTDYVDVADEAYSGNNTSYIPFYTRSFQGWAGSIIHKDSLPELSKICGMAYDVVSNGYVRDNQSVFFSHFNDPFFSDLSIPDESVMTPMYSGSIDFTTNGWNKIAFDTMFAMSDAKNLLVYTTQKSGVFNSTPTAYKPSVYGYNVGKYAYNNVSNEFPNGDGTITARIPNMRFYLLIPADAGISSLESPTSLCNTGNNALSVSLKNYGADTLTAATIKYQLDNGAVQSLNWTGKIASYHTQQLGAIGSLNLTYGEHTLKLWTEFPNGTDDYKPENDTIIRTINASNPLCGSYNIGEAPSDYLTLREAFDSLYSAGALCDVVFNIKPGTYNAQYLLTDFSDGKNYALTIQSQSGDSSDVVLTTDSTDYLINLNGISNISLKNLTLTSDSASILLNIANGSNKLLLYGNYFGGTSQTDNIVYSPEEANSIDSSISITNNLFRGGAVAISLASDGAQFENNNQIVSNHFIDQSVQSIALLKQGKYVVASNSFKINKGKVISVLASQEGYVANNSIHIGESYQEPVIFQGNVDTTIIANNFIEGENLSLGAVKLNGSNFIFVYNTIVSNSGGLNIYGNDKLIYNNIILSKQAGRTIIIDASGSNNISDYNCLYNSEANPIGAWNNTDYYTLADWQTASGLDAHSLSILPEFYSDTNLHTQSLFIDAKGVPIAGITNDIDGEVRNASTPDIGADEFTGAFSLESDITLCANAQHEIHAGLGYETYLWSTGADSNYILIDSTGVGRGSGTYIVTVTLYGKSYTDSVDVTFTSPLTALPPYYCAVAEDDSVQLSAAEGVAYNWSTGDTTQTIWLKGGDASVIVTDANGCQTSDEISRLWISCPANLNIPLDTMICKNDSIVLDANHTCNADYSSQSYLWNTGDTSETITVYTNDIETGYQQYNIQVTYTSADGFVCVTSDTGGVYNNTCPANIDVQGDNNLYIGETLTLDANSSLCDANYANYSYAWSTGDTTETIMLDATTLGLGNHTISVNVTNKATISGCVTEDNVIILVENEIIRDAIEELNISPITCSPNPSSGIVLLKSENEIKKVSITILNLAGQIVFSENHETLKNAELDLSSIEKGVYILFVQNRNKHFSKRIVLY